MMLSDRWYGETHPTLHASRFVSVIWSSSPFFHFDAVDVVHMLSHLQLFELLTLLTALHCCAGLPWDWLLCEHEVLCDAAEFLIMGGDELSSSRVFFHPLEGSSSEATLILSLESERFKLLTPSVLGLFRKLWNGWSVCFWSRQQLVRFRRTVP